MDGYKEGKLIVYQKMCEKYGLEMLMNGKTMALDVQSSECDGDVKNEVVVMRRL